MRRNQKWFLLERFQIEETTKGMHSLEPPPNCPKFVPHLQMCCSVRVHRCTHIICPCTTAMLWIHPIQMWDAAWLWPFLASTDTPMSFRLSHTPSFLKFTPPPPLPAPACITVKECTYMPIHSIKVLKRIVYIQYGCGMMSVTVCSRNHDTPMSFRLSYSTPFSQPPPPPAHVLYSSVRMHPYAHPQHVKVPKHFVHTSNMDVGCNQRWFAASTSRPWHPVAISAPNLPPVFHNSLSPHICTGEYFRAYTFTSSKPHTHVMASPFHISYSSYFVQANDAWKAWRQFPEV